MSHPDEEANVKNWQMDAVKTRLEQQERVIPRIEEKLDQILVLIQDRPTNAQVDDKLRVVKADAERDLKNALEKQDLKYEPVVRQNKTLLWGLVTTGLGLIGSLIMLIVAGITK